MSPDRWTWVLQLYHDHAAMVKAQAEAFSDLLGWVTVALIGGALLGAWVHQHWRGWTAWLRKI